ncbi:hypothetical protein [Nannocystis pusilla]|uniref:hypothetical protein n=1 Tax=Nannocystis pusilla TaxID=889268 RepID=UPI003BF14C82
MDLQSPLYFNGVDVGTGAYLFPPTSADELGRRLGRAAPADPQHADHLADLRARVDAHATGHYGIKPGLDANDLAQAGWAAVFPAVRPDTAEAARQDAIAEALQPLLALRSAQASAHDGRLFKIYRGPDGYRPGESKQRFLARLGAGPGPADPVKVPYYLLLVASPEELPFFVQYQLDVQYAVGRLHFDEVAEYAAYARSVVAAETGGLQLARELAMFAVNNPDDPATQLSSKHLVAPLADLLAAHAPDWTIRRHEGEAASKATLGRLLGGDATPALLFTASHGAGFSRGDPRQRAHQGALICQDWPGPAQWREPLPQDFYFAGDDLRADARPHGLVMFNFACYGAGTPMYDDYGQRAASSARTPIADAAFLAALPRRLLAHPNGGALATIGHVERAWGCSFLWPGSGKKTGSNAQLAVFEGAMRELLRGARVGAALECFNERYAELASDLSGELEEIGYGRQYDPRELADMWTANNDARAFAILGDPAVRLPLAPAGEPARRVPLPAIAVDSPTTEAAQEFTLSDAAPEPIEEAQPAVRTLRDALEQAVRSLGDLEVRTFVTADSKAIVTAGREQLPALAELRIVTRIGPGGDVDTLVPGDGKALDAELVRLHLELAKQAQAQRGELLQALLAALRAGSAG